MHKDISLKTLLVLGFMMAGLLPLMIFALMSYASSRTTLKERWFQQLESIRNIKVHQLEAFFKEREAQVRVLARSPLVHQFFRDLASWRAEGDGDRNIGSPSRVDDGFADEDSYRRLHDRYFSYFEYFVYQQGFYDLFLIDPDDGFVAFTVIKESDFGTTLSRLESPLSDAWYAARSTNDVVLTDTRLYRPSNDVPAQFAIIGVEDRGAVVGYLAVQISMDSIDRIMGERTGMGSTGETYLVGGDHLMRSDSYLDPAGRSVLASLSGTVEDNGVDTAAVRRALRGETGSAVVFGHDGTRVLSAFSPIDLGSFRWALMAEIDEDEIDQLIAASLNRRILFILMLSLMLLLSLAFLISAFVSRGITKVTSEVEGLVDEILQGRLDARSDPDTVGIDFRRVVARTNRLIEAFVNQINERRKIEEVMEYNQRMESIGTLAGGIAHDFNNILTYMYTYSDIVIGSLSSGTTEHDSMLEIQAAIHRASDLVSQVMAFSRQARQERRPIQVSLIVKEAVKLLKASLPKNISVRRTIESDDLFILAEPSQLYQITMNLCTNAFHAMQGTGGVLTVRLETEDNGPDPDAPACKLTVEDSGVGMDAATRRRIFEPYFTTKASGHGSGMGLAVVHGIVSSLKGSITVSSNPGKGTTVTVVLPAERRSRPAALAPSDPVPHHGSGRIVFVDDEIQICRSASQLLGSWGYSIDVFSNSLEADAHLANETTQADLVITDLNMTELNGIQLIERMRARGDNRPAILLTGYSEMLDDAHTERLTNTVVMFKPYLPKNLAQAIERALG